MKEIKFRAWDKEEGRMLNVLSINFNEEYIETNKHFRNFEDVELMQFTGLKDKNGIDIYEGDILQYLSYSFDADCISDSDDITNIEILGECIFIGGEFKHSKSSFGWEGESYIILTECYIVGNKFENRELLKT